MSKSKKSKTLTVDAKAKEEAPPRLLKVTITFKSGVQVTAVASKFDCTYEGGQLRSVTHSHAPDGSHKARRVCS